VPDILPLKKTIARREEGWVRHRTHAQDTQLRDGPIQRFELTDERSHKFLKRCLEQNAPSPEEYDRMPFSDLIRSGMEQGLLREGWPKWRLYREMKARTSHAYDEEGAMKGVEGIPDFLREAVCLRDQINANEPLSLTVRALLSEAFSESNLPSKVDMADGASPSPEFRKFILRHKIVVQPGNQSPGS
jgi:nucleotidyltransferase substrate binding protein (TIGR01987 family)